MNKERILKSNRDYIHFKGNVYHVKGISNPTYMIESIEKKYKYCKVNHTETNEVITIYRVYSEKLNDYIYCHDYNEDKQELVIYFRKENIDLAYGRPKNMFISKVDKDKYPDVDQVYRFEELNTPRF